MTVNYITDLFWYCYYYYYYVVIVVVAVVVLQGKFTSEMASESLHLTPHVGGSSHKERRHAVTFKEEKQEPVEQTASSTIDVDSELDLDTSTGELPSEITFRYNNKPLATIEVCLS